MRGGGYHGGSLWKQLQRPMAIEAMAVATVVKVDYGIEEVLAAGFLMGLR